MNALPNRQNHPPASGNENDRPLALIVKHPRPAPEALQPDRRCRQQAADVELSAANLLCLAKSFSMLKVRRQPLP